IATFIFYKEYFYGE
ncbi:DUF1270 family protein, partial [Staphylococcus aureus]|nr:DUF1270 family protein [Staphylococcus aureus]